MPLAKRIGGFPKEVLFCGLFLLLTLAAPAEGGSYADSSHGNATSGVNRSSIDSRYNRFVTGNCAHCHEQHASLGGMEPSPVAGSPSKALGFATEQNLCLTCHDGSPAGSDIAGQFGKLFKHGQSALSVDYMSAYDNRHDAGESSSTDFSGSERHAECADCHNPHQATNANPILGASGIVPTNGSPWTDPGFGASTAPVASADDQYQVCFKCHSNWAGSGTGTNQAKEFSTSNASYHNVEGSLTPPSDNGYGNFNMTYVFKMMPRYAGYTDAQLRNVAMRCSDCHGDTDISPQGIHGSGIGHILKVPVGSSYTSWDSSTTAQGNAWCFNCHDASFTNTGFTNGQGNYHNIGHHKDKKCMSCHIRVPHGWKVPHLLKPSDLGPVEKGDYDGAPEKSIPLPTVSDIWDSSGNWRCANCH